MENNIEKLGEIIDELDSIAHALTIPLPEGVHLRNLKTLIPEKVKDLKEIYIEISGENPWE